MPPPLDIMRSHASCRYAVAKTCCCLLPMRGTFICDDAYTRFRRDVAFMRAAKMR